MRTISSTLTTEAAISPETSLIIYRIPVDLTYSNTQLTERKRKAVPLQAWSGPEVSSKLRFPDFMTTGQDGGKVVSLRHRPTLPP